MFKKTEKLNKKQLVELIEINNIRSVYVMVNSDIGKICLSVDKDEVLREVNSLTNTDEIRVEYSLYKPYISLCILNYNVNVD